MATIKSYTSLWQSKKLAEILPLESADMNYWCGTQIRIGGHRTMNKDMDIPCWSLSALLDVLPYPYLEQDRMDKWICRVDHANTAYMWEDYNPVDALYNMIIKLKELNLL